VQRLHLGRVSPTRPRKFGSNEARHIERWKPLRNLLGRLPVVADELEHLTIGAFHE
jgi:hypothetical protein